MKLKTISAVIAATLALAAAGASQAADRLWTFQDTLLADGSAVTGSFHYDADANLYSNVNVSVSAGVYQAANFTNPILYGRYTGPSQLDLLQDSYVSGDATGFEQLYFVFSSPLTDAGGTVPIVNGAFSPQLLTCGDPACYTGSNTAAQLNGGGHPGAVTTAVPEPAAWALMILGFGGIGAMARGERRRAATAA